MILQKCIRMGITKFHLGRYIVGYMIVGYMFGNQVLKTKFPTVYLT